MADPRASEANFVNDAMENETFPRSVRLTIRYTRRGTTSTQQVLLRSGTRVLEGQLHLYQTPGGHRVFDVRCLVRS